MAGTVKVTPSTWVYVPLPYAAVATRTLRGVSSVPSGEVGGTCGPVDRATLTAWPAIEVRAAAEEGASLVAGISIPPFAVPTHTSADDWIVTFQPAPEPVL